MKQPNFNFTFGTATTIRLVSITLLLVIRLTDICANTRQFHSVYSSNELSSVRINKFFQSKDGMLWIGTPKGLNLYDGYRFRHFSPNLPNNDSYVTTDGVTDIQEDISGNLWLRDNGKTVYFDLRKEIFTPLPLKIPGYDEVDFFDFPFHIDNRQQIWIADGQNLHCFSPDYKLIRSYALPILGELNNLRMIDYSDKLYVLDNIGKVFVVANDKLQPLPIPIPSNNRTDWYKILIDRNVLWIGNGSTTTLGGINLVSNEWTPITLPNNLSKSNTLHDLTADEDGNLWIATDHEGIFVYNPSEKRFIQHYSPDFSSNQHSIPSNNVTAIFFDSDKNLWVGFDKHGMRVSSLFPRGISDNFNPDLGDVKALLNDRQGRLWIGTDGRGLFMKKPDETKPSKLPLPNLSVMSLIEDRNGRIIAGTYDHGLYIINNDGSINHLSTSVGNLPNDKAWFLNEDREGKIWVSSSLDDPYVIDPNGKITVLKFNSGGDIRALATYYEGGDSIYMSTGYGFSAFNIYNLHHGTPHLKNRKGDSSFRHNFICALWKDTDDIVWLGHQDGLTAWKLDTDSVYHITHKEGIGQYISFITEDNNRRIWVGTRNGMYCISKAFTTDNNVSFGIRSFFESDGLRSNYITHHSHTLKNNGDLMFGGVDGYTTLSPPLLYSPQSQPAQIHFTALRKNNEYIKVDSVYDGFFIDESIKYLKELNLKGNTGNLTIEFASSDVINNHEKWYAYKIRNHNEKDSEWIVTHDNSITLSHLQPGDYTLIVKPYKDAADLNTDNAAILDIRVERPIFLRWWAIMIYVLLLVIAVLLWLRYQKKRNLTRLTNQAEKYIEESKLRFFTNVSHDLRTQLTLVLSPLQLLEKENLSTDTKNKVGHIRHNAEILLDQINSLLDFRKLDVGGETLSMRTSEVAPFIQELFSRFENYALSRDMRYNLNMTDCDCYLTLDFDKVTKIVTNLISNAFKYTPRGGSVEINACVKSTDLSEETLVISVADTGKGVKDEDKLKIFDRFFQADHSDGETGSGIGLHIVKEYVNLMEGTVKVEDNNPKGTVFTITLPSKRSENTHPESQEESTEQLPATVLFVDDNENLRQMVREGLSPYYNVIVASDGKEALEKLEKNVVNIVISDVMMPGMDGYELCKSIKNNINFSHIPVILLTARTADIHRKEGLELGADDYLTKPFSFDILRLRIDKFIELSLDHHKSFHNKIEVNPSEITITSLDAELMDRALKIVEENISDGEFSVNTLSDKLAMSRSSLYKKIMAITGAGPADFIRIIRLKRACQLLRESGLRVSEIAYMVGFNSPKRFSVNFKAEYGMTPSEYQQKYGDIESYTQN